MMLRVAGHRSWILIVSLLLVFGACNDDDPIITPTEPPEAIDLSTSFYYEVDLEKRFDDKFRLSLFVGSLANENSVF